MKLSHLILTAFCVAALITTVASAQTDTTFTYQGELKQNDDPANGQFDMEFSLWDADFDGIQFGAIPQVVQVVNGKFTVELDFETAFDNSNRWLEIEVNGVTLSPRNPITRAPYAIQTRGIAVDADHNVGLGTNSPNAKLSIEGDTIRALNVIALEGNIGTIGIESKSLAFHGAAIVAIANSGSGAVGVYGESLEGLAGRFIGDVDVTGTLSKSAGSFKIDHPLDPENKYLSHSFVESPDMMNVYNGNIATDSRGFATVELPEWFEVLNRDFRYQLTVIANANDSDFVQAMVVERMKDNRFKIRTSAPNTEVSWQVTGVRQDPYAEVNRIPVEEMKPTELRGLFRHPELYGRTSEFHEESIKLSRSVQSEATSNEGAGDSQPAVPTERTN